MFHFAFRLLWRLIIFALIIALAYGTAFVAYPYLDSRLPVFFVVIILYVIVAYFAIPLLFRIWRLVFKPNHIPIYATTPDGWPADPVNIAVIAHDEMQLTSTMEAAGWYKADKSTLKNMIKEGISIATGRPYLRAPFSSLYLFGRKFDIGYQKPRYDGASASQRHHVRFWRLHDLPDEHTNAVHHSFWRQYFDDIFKTDKHIWIGAAIDDTGPVGLRWRNFQITHKNDPETNKERDLIVNDIADKKLIKNTTLLQANEPFSFYGQTLGNRFICDGQIKVIELKHPAFTKIITK